MGTANDGQSLQQAGPSLWRDVDYEPFPDLPLSVQQPVPDRIQHQFEVASLKATPALINASWALVSSRLKNSPRVIFGTTTLPGEAAGKQDNISVSATDISPIRVSLSGHLNISEYLGAMEKQMADEAQHGKSRLNATEEQQLHTLLVHHTRTRGIRHWQTDGGEQSAHTYALVIETCPSENKMTFISTFDATVIKQWEVRKLLRRLEYVSIQIGNASPDQKLKEINMVTPDELDELWTWNVTTPAQVNQCMYSMFEKQVQVQPNAPAICAWDGELSYGELYRLVKKLALTLVGQGIGPEVLVPLCFEKSMWTAVAMLGVTMAGGAFVLLDPSFPEKRLHDVVGQVNARLMLSSASNQALSSRLVNNVIVISSDYFRSVHYEREDEDHVNKQATRQLPYCNPSSLLFLCFTSGSTGTSKSAMATHANIASALHHQVSYLHLTPESRIFDFASYSFATTLCNFFLAIYAGGCLCVPGEEDRRRRLPESITALRANVMEVTPTLARLLSPEDTPTLELIIFSGERSDQRDFEPWRGSKVHVAHTYGSSECLFNSTINYQPPALEETLHIGHAVGAAAWVVDPDDYSELLPIGAIGELLLEGPIVGRGYLGNPEKTASVFINDPAWLLQGSSSQPGRHGRLYRTGDLVKFNGDGTLVFIGRKDTQVKVRGQRVELAEVEHWVRKCTPEAIHVAAEVIVPQNGKTGPFLAAFIQLGPEQHPQKNSSNAASQGNEFDPAGGIGILPTSDSVEKRIAEQLPSYMVPTVFFTMGKLPTTNTGKLNRKQLRTIGASLPIERLAAMRASRRVMNGQVATEAEQCVQKLWSQVLNIDACNLGLEDNFFHLGGDSIAAMMMTREARKIGLKLTVADILRYPTIRQFTKHSISRSATESTEIEAFSLLGDRFDIASFLRVISSHYHDVDPARVQDVCPCTPLQEGLMSLALKQAGDYIMQVVIELAPDVRLNDLCTAWEQVTRATPVLRTRIVQHDHHGLVQIVLDEDIRWIHATGLENYQMSDKAHSMALGDPLTRYALVRDDAGKAKWLVWTVHHCLFDGWSMNLIAEAVHRAYLGKQIDNGPSFQSFIKYIQDQKDEALVDYWRRAMAGSECVPFPEALPSTKQPVKAASSVEEFEFPRIPTSANVSTATLIRAAWALIAGRTTNSHDVVFGSTVSGRGAPVEGVESMVAPTFTTIPVRVTLPGNQRVSDYLDTVQQQSTDMIPFEQAGLHRIAKISPECRKTCKFQTLLVIQPQDANSTKVVFGRWNWDDKQMTGMGTYAITLQVHLGSDTIMASAAFDATVIEPWVLKGLLRRLPFVMRQLNDAQDMTLSEVKTATAQDLNQIWEWNKAVPESVERCVHDIIDQNVQLQPHSPAVCAWDGSLTYGELGRLATILAGQLVSSGVEPGMVIPLCFRKSMWTTVSMLAVLKAGGAFILLDCSVPQDYLQHLVRQVDARLILSSPDTQSIASRLCPDVLVVGPESLLNMEGKTFGPLPSIKPESVAYIVFTSGSTGNPKGVVIPHTSFSSAIHHQAGLLFSRGSRIFDFASHSFDAPIHNTLMILAAGGCLCVPRDEDRKDNLAASMASLRANVATLTPSVARTLSPEQVPGLKSILFVGEMLHATDVAPWRGKVDVVNIYGPTECTPVSRMNFLSARPQDAPCMGRGVGLVTWVVDPDNHDHLLPAGCIGELVLEGPLVGRGYLNDPERNATVFIEDPKWLTLGTFGRPGRRGRLYNTGDLVRYNEDGTLTCIGRRDAQVKIRGQRVELGEVEQHVRACIPGVKQVAAEVIVPGGQGAVPTLAVFVAMDDATSRFPGRSRNGAGKSNGDSRRTPTSTASSGTNGTCNGTLVPQVIAISAQVENELARRLPAYMLPTVYFALEALPLNNSGKTDRRRLRQLGASFSAQQLAELRTCSDSHVQKRPPSTSAERELQRIWAGVLNINAATIGIDDSFLRLGGDSITAMQVSAAARLSGVSISTAEILQKKTIALLAATSSACEIKPDPAVNPTKTAEPDDGQPFRLSPIQQLYMQVHENPTSQPFDQSFLLELRASVSLASVSRSIEAIVSRHSMLRARFSKASQGAWQQHISSDILGSFHVCQEHTSESSASKANDGPISRCRQRLNIEDGPLVAAVLLQDTKSQSLFITIHHLVVDFVSWRILLRELEMLITERLIYTQVVTSFRTWCSLQAQYAASQLGPGEGHGKTTIQPSPLSYWGFDMIADRNSTLATSQFVLDEPSTDAIMGSCNEAFGTRPVELMITALAYSFSTVFTDRPSVSIFSEGHGREPWDDLVDLSHTVGWFTTIFPVHMPALGHANLLDATCRTKDFIRSFPKNGWSYFTSKFGDKKAAAANISEFPVEVLFNYAGSYQQFERDDALFRNIFMPNDPTTTFSTGLRQLALFDIEAHVDRGRFTVSFDFPDNIRHRDRIEAWVEQYQVTLKQLAETLKDRPFQCTLSNFPLAFTSYQDINEFQRRLSSSWGITRVEDIDDVYPCTPLQKDILKAQKKDSRKYRIELGVTIRGCQDKAVDLLRIEQAWVAVVRRQSLLRTLLVDDIPGTNEPMHIVLKDYVPKISHVQAAENVPLQARPRVVGYQKHGPQHHLSVYQCNGNVAQLQLEINHAICDGYSIDLLLRDFRSAYNRTLEPNGPLFGEYVKYIFKQRPWSTEPKLHDEGSDDIVPCFIPVLGDSRDRKHSSTFRVDVPDMDTFKIRTFCAEWEITAATLIKTAWAIVLYKYTGLTSPCFGNLVSRRDAPVAEASNMFGPLMDLVPCRVDLVKEQKSVLQILRKLNAEFIHSLSNQTPSGTNVRQCSSKPFNTAISFQRAAPDLSLTDDGHAIFMCDWLDPVEWDIYVRVEDSADTISVTLEFWHDKASQNAAVGVAECLSAAISSITADPDKRLRAIL